MEKIFKDKRMAAVANSKPGDVDTSGWFETLSKDGEERKKDPNSIMNRVKDKRSWFCHFPFSEMFIELDGRFKACCLAAGSKDHNINNTSIKSWMEDSKYMNDLRKEMLDPAKHGTKAINEHCIRCISDEKRYGKSRRTHHMWKESSTKERWDAIERNVRMYEKTGVWTFDERIMQIQLKSFGVECNLDCHMCNHDSSSMRIDMMRKHDVYSEKMFGSMEKTNHKIKLVEDNLNKIDKKDVIEQIKELAPYLNSIKIIGGEPLIMKKYFEFLEEIVKTGHAPHIKIKFQTNLTKLGEGKHKFIDFVPKFKETSFTASIDGINQNAEYLRRRSNWKEIEENIGNLLQELSSNKKIGHGEFNIRNIIGVSKKKSYEQIKIAYSCGIRSFGENYVQELEGKYKLNEIDGLNLEWHFIGPIQSNKIRSISKYASWVHSICRKKEVDILDSECLLQGKLMNILIQVNISNEDTKSGLLPEELMDFAEYIVEEKKNLLLKGIMVMPALSEDSSETIRVMNKSKELHQVMAKEYSFANTLSMGTTSDYMHAIDCGSSMIRIGELIFGKRQL